MLNSKLHSECYALIPSIMYLAAKPASTGETEEGRVSSSGVVPPIRPAGGLYRRELVCTGWRWNNQDLARFFATFNIVFTFWLLFFAGYCVLFCVFCVNSLFYFKADFCRIHVFLSDKPDHCFHTCKRHIIIILPKLNYCSVIFFLQ